MMNKEFNTLNVLPEIRMLLDGLNCNYKVHRQGDEGFAYLDGFSACVTIFAPNSDRTIFIDSECGIFLYFEEEDCDSLCESNFNSFAETLTAVLKNEICSASIYVGETKTLLSSGLKSKSEVEEKPVAELFAAPALADYYKKVIEKDGAEARFIFWDSKFDKMVVIEKKS